MVFLGIVTNHSTIKIRFGAVPVTKVFTEPPSPVAKSSQYGYNLGIFVVKTVELPKLEVAVPPPNNNHPSGETEYCV